MRTIHRLLLAAFAVISVSAAIWSAASCGGSNAPVEGQAPYNVYDLPTSCRGYIDASCGSFNSQELSCVRAQQWVDMLLAESESGVAADSACSQRLEGDFDEHPCDRIVEDVCDCEDKGLQPVCMGTSNTDCDCAWIEQWIDELEAELDDASEMCQAAVNGFTCLNRNAVEDDDDSGGSQSDDPFRCGDVPTTTACIDANCCIKDCYDGIDQSDKDALEECRVECLRQSTTECIDCDDSLFECISKSGCPTGGGADLLCILRNCDEQYRACYGGPIVNQGCISGERCSPLLDDKKYGVCFPQEYDWTHDNIDDVWGKRGTRCSQDFLCLNGLLCLFGLDNPDEGICVNLCQLN